MKSKWATMVAAAAVLGLLAGGAWAKDVVKGAGDDKSSVIQINGKSYRLVPLDEEKPVKVKGEKDAGEPRKEGEGGKVKGEGGKGEIAKGEKDFKRAGAGSLAGKKVILRVDDQEYVAIIVAELTGKGQVEKGKFEGEKPPIKHKPIDKTPPFKGGEKDK